MDNLCLWQLIGKYCPAIWADRRKVCALINARRQQVREDFLLFIYESCKGCLCILYLGFNVRISFITLISNYSPLLDILSQLGYTFCQTYLTLLPQLIRVRMLHLSALKSPIKEKLAMSQLACKLQAIKRGTSKLKQTLKAAKERRLLSLRLVHKRP